MSSDDFLSRHSDWKNVYYDEDLRELRKTVKHLKDVMDLMEKRYYRHETIQISKSVFDYVTAKEMSIQYPQQLYNFQVGDYRIAIKRVFLQNRKDSRYTCVCLGFVPDWRFNQYRNEYGYFLEEKLEDCVKCYVDIVHSFTSEYLGALF